MSKRASAFILFGVILGAAAIAAFFPYRPGFVVSEGTYPPLDTSAYNRKIADLANYPKLILATSTATSTVYGENYSWPVKTVYPLGGAWLPFNRIVAYYGNFYSAQMGVLGQYPPEQMLQMLKDQAAEWQAAATGTPVIPALDYIAVAAQNNPGPDGMYRLRMPEDQIQKAISLANQISGLVVLDVQIGLSTVQKEVPLLAPYLKLPNVELALDPEFSMRDGGTPGERIGTMDAKDIDYAAEYLAGLVRQYHLPPKFLVVHRFTEEMVTNAGDIEPLPEAQIVMDMDGFGTPAQKQKAYRGVVASEPVQFTGIKLFYKNDVLQPGSHLMAPEEVLKLSPQPIFIQYH